MVEDLDICLSTGFVQAIIEGKDGKATHSQQTLQVLSHACLLFPATYPSD
jgi:hypothetical protein